MPDGSPVLIGANVPNENWGTTTTGLHKRGSVSGPALEVWSDSGSGLFGHSPDSSGVHGETDSSSSAGVWGYSTTASPGVVGYADGSNYSPNQGFPFPAVLGVSDFAYGVRGVSRSKFPAPPSTLGVGVIGYSTNKFLGIGVIGASDSPIGFGGVFYGGLVVYGSKSAAVPHPDGSQRLLYSMESPESWFEDFGRAKLVRGKAKVKLEVTFAAVVRTDDYHIFLSPEGETNGLYISARNRSGFEVREHRRGKSSVTFSYRVVARRKDIKAKRLAKIDLPPFDGKEQARIPKASTRMPKAIGLRHLTKGRKVRKPKQRGKSSKSGG